MVSTIQKPKQSINHKGILLDLTIYIAVMFLVREVYIPNLFSLLNGLLWTLTTLAVATWRMKARGYTWKDLGLRKPKSFKKTLLISILVVIVIAIAIITFNILQETLGFLGESESTSKSSNSSFKYLKGNWLMFFSIMPIVLVESFLEELLDRAFLITWFEKLFSKTMIATILAVLMQALIFGFRHSNDISERSITVAIIGLIMGIAYVKFDRNLWPIIIAHCILNTMSMIDRV
ncbi:MAG: CPBP family intramembrane glutamic endopeptidase [Psychroserpens sp.]|uniref:CPBP family intramembrane glutamic endopeptidase n=1 Tax=Psychroserpens sp. TaxID=2020870 RepID=UPI0030030346